MFKRRDIPPVLLLLLLIILVMLTLSQILVVHNGRYGRNVHNMRKLQLELREMDVNLHALMMQNVPSIELNRRLLQGEINAHRFAELLSQASKPDNKSTTSHFRRGVGGTSGVENATKSVPGTAALDSAQNKRSVRSKTLQHNRTVWAGRSLTESLNADGSPHSDSLKTQPPSPPRSQPPAAGYLPDKTAESSNDPSRTDDSRPAARWQQGRLASIPKTSSGSSSSGPDRPRPGSRPELKYCPSVPPLLKGRLNVDLENSSSLTWHNISRENPDVKPGGTWLPPHCVARHRVAIIIPYRDRERHLLTLLYYLHPILQRQQVDYRVYVVEQYGQDTFNKARIMNIAFVEALKHYNFQCFVFHDVDLVPEYDTNMYSCPLQPRHMSVAIDEMGYKLAYQELVGGVLNMRTQHFQKVNGYSNLYWGWGAEDDDMAYRIMHVGLKITRPPEACARYKMAKHTKRKPSDWRKRAKLLYTGTRRFQFDGLNSLQYKVIKTEEMPFYTHLIVDIGKPPRGF